MDAVILTKSLIMGIVEGITEFPPISSTGHLILAGELLDFPGRTSRGVYEIFIQLGAVLAVAWENRVKIGRTLIGISRPGSDRNLLFGILLAFLPAAGIGLLFGKAIKTYLFSPVPVALAFIIGGAIILWAEKRESNVRVKIVDAILLKDAFMVGMMQCLALIPGTSRAGATIIGGLFLGLSRKAATEFSFLLGVPTLGAAALYSLHKFRHELSSSDVGIFAVGLVAAFASALLAVRALLRFMPITTSSALHGIGSLLV